MENIINRVNITIWLPTLVCSFVMFLCWLSGINITHSLYDFIIGNSYDVIGVIVPIVWLVCLGVGLAIYSNRDAYQAGSKEPVKEQGSLYKIKELRSNPLKHISALSYNKQSDQVIERFNPKRKLPAHLIIESEAEREQTPTSITAKFSDNGGKKNEIESTTEQNNSDQKNETVVDSTSHKTTPSSGTININTAIKGESFATEERLNKYKELLKKANQKKKKVA